METRASKSPSRASVRPMMRSAYLLGILALTACAGARREALPALFSAATLAGFPSTVRYLSADRRALESRTPEVPQRIRKASKDGTVNILALSGGGSGGAFGAGALVGLSRRGERPQYQLVTGVSTGALIAPFAFLGPAWDAQLSDAFSGGHTEGLLRSRGLAILFHPGVYRSAPLIALVDHFVTNELLQAVAREYATGRMLLVATTDLDKQERYHMNFKFTAIPVDYPRVGSLDFRASTMRSLFNYGADYAQEGLLWATVDEARAHFEKAVSEALKAQEPDLARRIPGCPLVESSLAPGASEPAVEIPR